MGRLVDIEADNTAQLASTLRSGSEIGLFPSAWLNAMCTPDAWAVRALTSTTFAPATKVHHQTCACPHPLEIPWDSNVRRSLGTVR